VTMNSPLIDPSGKRSRLPIFIGALVFVLTTAASVSAQGVGSSRGLSSGEGSNTIQGRVYFPPGESSMGRGVKLHLESNGTTGNPSTVTDVDGSFRFNGISPGNYTVVVDGGKEYESTREPVNIDLGARGRITQVTIQLRSKVDSSNPAFAGVPRAALEAYQKGAAAAQKGDAKTAIQFLTQAVAAAPNFALALSDLGNQYEKQFQWNMAAETFGALVKLKPTDALAQTSLGIALYNEGAGLMGQQKFEEAEKKFNACEAALREAIRLKAPGPTAHYYLGLMLIKFKAYADAQTELELAISNGGENLAPAHKFLGGVYMSLHKNKEAADELEKFLKLQPKDPDAEKIKKSISDLRSKP
jgi:Tfp pilus assembly protein PilF